jgi:hypothetical protein
VKTMKTMREAGKDSNKCVVFSSIIRNDGDLTVHLEMSFARRLDTLGLSRRG